MADQTTTVASLPSGFATLAGLIYAVSAVPPKIWSHTAWSKVARFPWLALSGLNTDKKRTLRLASNPSESDNANADLTTLCSKISGTVTRKLRKIRGGYDSTESLGEIAYDVATLYLFSSWKVALTEAPVDPTGIATGPHASESSPVHDGSKQVLRDNSPAGLAPDSESRIFPDTTVTVIVVNHDGIEHSRDITVTDDMIIAWVNNGCSQPSEPSSLLNEASRAHLADYVRSTDFVRRVKAQRAGTFSTWLIELAHKMVEILFAAGIVLGSNAGAWFGLTLASIFPQRVAAGVYASSYGQVLPRRSLTEHENEVSEHRFTPTGTVWNERLSIPPSSRCLADDTRNALGYCFQYAALYSLQWNKQRVRGELEFGNYGLTRDTVRYFVLIIVPLVLVICCLSLWAENSSRPGKSWCLWRTSALIIYAITILAGITCVVLGQGPILKLDEFYLVSRIVDPIAAVGSVAAVHLAAKSAQDLTVVGEGWSLIWIMGGCTVVW